MTTRWNTPDEMRSLGLELSDLAVKTVESGRGPADAALIQSAILLTAAEICQRLDRLIELAKGDQTP